MNFNELNLIAPILQAVASEGYTTPTPIQQQAIPQILQQRDVLGCAQTGTGKTAAFSIPILQLLHGSPKKSRAIRTLILTPTRELAIQIEQSLQTYGSRLPLRHTAIFGGVPQGRQVAAIQAGVDILIATPGRLQDLMQQGLVSIAQIEILVLDEADRMLDMGFVNDVKRIIAKLPVKRQTLLFSATMPQEIRSLANSILISPVEVTVTPVSSTAQKVQQSVCFLEKNDKTPALIYLLSDKSVTRSLVFTRTKHGADKLVKQLLKANISAAAIHGNKSQGARQKALEDFKASRIRVLVATDIAARGIDIDDLPHVVNYDVPNVAETYVHRIGRTGRAGMEGSAVLFCSGEERDDLKAIQKLIGFSIPVMEVPIEKGAGSKEQGAGDDSADHREQGARNGRGGTGRREQGARNNGQQQSRRNGRGGASSKEQGASDSGEQSSRRDGRGGASNNGQQSSRRNGQRQPQQQSVESATNAVAAEMQQPGAGNDRQPRRNEQSGAGRKEQGARNDQQPRRNEPLQEPKVQKPQPQLNTQKAPAEDNSDIDDRLLKW